MALKTGIIVGSTRQGRMGERVARWVEQRVKLRPALSTTWIDVAEWTFAPYPHAQPTKMAEKSYADPRERAWVELVAAQDAFIIVTPEYNHGYPAGLKNALDYTYAGWNKKPVAFVSYGGPSGGVRAVQQLRQVAVELQMAPLRDEVNLPFVFRALDDAGVPKDEHHHKRAEAMLDELVWWGNALAAARAQAQAAG